MARKEQQWTQAEVFAAEDALIDFQFAVLNALEEKGMTQADLAHLLGVSKGRVSQLLSSEANPTVKQVGRTLHLLGLKPIFGKGAPEMSNDLDFILEPVSLDWFPRNAKPLLAWNNTQSKPANNNVQGRLKAA